MADNGAAVSESTATAEDGAATALTGEAMAEKSGSALAENKAVALMGEVGEAMAMLDGAAMALAGQAAEAMAGEGTAVALTGGEAMLDGLDGAAGRTVAHHGEAASATSAAVGAEPGAGGIEAAPATGAAVGAEPGAGGIDWHAFVDRNNQFIDWAVTKFKRIEESQTKLLGQFQRLAGLPAGPPPPTTHGLS